MTKDNHVSGNKPKTHTIRVDFSPEEVAAAKEQMRQLGIGTFSDYLRLVLKRALGRTD